MVNGKVVAQKLSKLAMLKYFPADEGARLGILEIVCGMISSEDQVDWLVKRMLVLYNEWPGPHELRACFCSRYRPADGINAYSQIYTDGIPSERPALQIAGPALKALPAGSKATADPTLEAVVCEAANLMAMPRPMRTSSRFTKLLNEALTAPADRAQLPGPTPQIITAADVEREVQALRLLQIAAGSEEGRA